MSKRITIVMQDSTHKKMRLLHSKMVAEAENSVSFSKVIEIVLQKGLKK